MGSASSIYRVSEDLREVITNDRWLELLGKTGDSRLVDVNLAKIPFDDRTLGFCFKMEYCGQQPPGANVILMFPNLNESGKRTLDTGDYRRSFAALDREINARLEQSKIDAKPVLGKLSSLKLAIACGEHVFRIWNITGNIYVYWMRTLHIYNTSGVGQLPLLNVPMLVETDSRMGYRSLVHFHFTSPPYTATSVDVGSVAGSGLASKSHDPLNIRGNTAGYIPIVDAQSLFNCDDDPRTIVTRKITTVSRAVAADRVVTSEMANMLLTLQGQDVPAEDDLIVVDGYTMGGGTSGSDIEYGGTAITLDPMTPRTNKT